MIVVFLLSGKMNVTLETDNLKYTLPYLSLKIKLCIY